MDKLIDDISESDIRLLEKVTNEFFPVDGPIVTDSEAYGQSLNELNQYVIGTRSGPSNEITNLFHEMGHFADRKIEKLKEYPAGGWGYSQGKFWQMNSCWGYETYTDQQIRLEAKCWAYQISLMKYYKFALQDKENCFFSNISSRLV